MRTRPLLSVLLLALAAAALASQTAWAGTWHPGGFPTPAGPVAHWITDLYNIIFVIITVIALVVALPVVYILWRFRRNRVATPATFSHSTALELAWTIVPALICFFIAYASYHAMVRIRTMPPGAANVEVVAYQFGWDFYYPDASEDGTHVAAAEPTTPDPQLSSAGQERLVKEMVIPAGVPVVLHVTAADVIHAFFVPELGVKIDAVPGRVNYVWMQADKPGVFLGQCAELCGSAHSEMFFKVRAVSPADYATYLQERRVAAGLPPVAAAVSASVAVSGSAVISGTGAPASVVASPSLLEAPASATLVSPATGVSP